MRGLTLPPQEEDFTADPVELFFDLGYVLAFSRLVAHLIHHPTWSGVGEAALLLWIMWLSWSQFTWSANAVSGNGRAVRLIFLLGTATSIPMAASVTTAFGPGGPIFAISIAIIYVLAIVTMVLPTDKGAAVRRSISVFGGLVMAGLVTLVIGSFLDGSARTVLWIIMAAIAIVAMVVAGRFEWIVRTGHFAERHGLIVIIALGEVIVAIGAAVVRSLEEDAGVPADTMVALVGAGVFAGLLWWAYFDTASPALEHRGGEVAGDLERGWFARDVYSVAHLPIVAGIVLAAAGLEEIALHPGDEAPLAFRAMLVGGLALFLGGIAAAVWRAYRVVVVERITAAVVIGGLGLALAPLAGTVLLIVIDAVLAAILVIETLRYPRAV